MDMRKISVTMLLVLALALLVGCDNAATGGTGSGSETENDYLAPLLGTWKTEGYDEGKFVTFTFGEITNTGRASYTFTRTDMSMTLQQEGKAMQYDNEKVEGADESYIYIGNVKNSYKFAQENGEAVLWLGTVGPLYKSN